MRTFVLVSCNFEECGIYLINNETTQTQTTNSIFLQLLEYCESANRAR